MWVGDDVHPFPGRRVRLPAFDTARLQQTIRRLQSALAAVTPARTDSNLLIGTWNIRALGDLTTKWLAGPKDSPKRDWHAVACLAAVISRFDVVAVQESRRNALALKRLMADLGPHWQVIISDVTEGSAGNGERLAFLYDSTRVQPSGASSEITASGSATRSTKRSSPQAFGLRPN